MNNHQKILIISIAIINMIAYVLMCLDKYKSKHKGRRISESTLFWIAFLLGAIGIYAGMKMPLYHKTAKNKFRFGIPCFVILNSAVIIYLFKYLRVGVNM